MQREMTENEFALYEAVEKKNIEEVKKLITLVENELTKDDFMYMQMKNYLDTLKWQLFNVEHLNKKMS